MRPLGDLDLPAVAGLPPLRLASGEVDETRCAAEGEWLAPGLRLVANSAGNPELPLRDSSRLAGGCADLEGSANASCPDQTETVGPPLRALSHEEERPLHARRSVFDSLEGSASEGGPGLRPEPDDHPVSEWHCDPDLEREEHCEPDREREERAESCVQVEPPLL